jgi:LysM repeat protein
MEQWARLGFARMNARSRIATLYLPALLVFVCGCEAFDSMRTGGSAAAQPQVQAEYNYLEERVRILTERVESLQREVAGLQSRLDQLQAGAGTQASATELQQLRAQVQALEAQRERDKQAILDQVAREIAGVASARATTSRTPSGSGSDVGYEHVVKQGETLFDIAKAYRVTVAAIKKANNLTSDNIRIGQKLFIPKAP